VIAAIPILPGAATLFRREVLLAHPFSRRSRTEDADLSLGLARQGLRLALADRAVASTVVPDSWAALLAQRTRWIAGHLQCCVLHTFQRGGARWPFRLLIFPNFVVSTLMVPCASIALAAVWMEGRMRILGLDWSDATLVSIALAYVQRGSAWMLAGRRRAPVGQVLLEPFVTNLVSCICFLAALGALARGLGRRQASCRPRRAA